MSACSKTESFDKVLPSRAEKTKAFEPFITAHVDPDAPIWKQITVDTKRRLRRQLLHRFTFGRLPGRSRNQKSVDVSYSQQWRDIPIGVQLDPQGEPGPCEWHEERYLAHAVGTKRVPLLMLMRAIEYLKPRTVLEAGSGNGLNLLVLAARFPNIRFTGVELTANGVEAARATAERPYDPALERFSPEPLVDPTAVRSIEFVQGDCRSLDFRSGAFDLVFTNLALEQMEEIRDAALSEIARVSDRYVAMIEPFRDFNDKGTRRKYVRANNYFSARVSDLTRFGLEPIFVTADMPHKITLKPGFVVARKT